MSDSEGSDGSGSPRSSRSGSVSPKRKRFEADEAEEGEDEDVADEQEPEGEDLDGADSEEEEEDNDYRSKKKRKIGANARDFIIDEAEVDTDDEEDEDAWKDDINDELDPNEADEAGQTAADIEARLRERDRKFGMLNDAVDEQEIEAYYRNRYNEDTAAIARFGEGGEEMSDEITQQTLLPEVKDPNLWMVKCRIGEEKVTVLQLMRKMIAYQFEDEPLQIRSVVAPEHVKGYIYVEAFKQTHVKAAIDGISNLRMGMYAQQMVPIKEMTDVLRVVKEQAGLKSKQWVRIKRGVFKDDLAQVDYVDVASNQVHLKLLPRIDYGRLRGALRSNTADDLKRKKFKRPPCKLFDAEKIRAIGGEITNDGDFQIFEGNRYSRKGFLYKNFVMNAILAEGVKPTLSELERFEETPEGLDIEIATADKEEVAHSFSNGDMVEVIEGELQNLQGKVIAIDGSKITIMPKHEDLKDPLEFQSNELKKYFRQGDHVRVIGGRYEGDTGLIVRVEENMIVLFSDLTMHELKTLPKDLQLCTDMATGVDSLGQYQFGDMVQIDAQTVGVIVQIQKESFQVLNMHGKVVPMKPAALQKKRENKKAAALDSEQNAIQCRDIVKCIDGPHSGRQGEIKHLFRNYAFLHSRMMLDNGGIFVCKCRHLVLAGAGGAGGGVGGKEDVNDSNLNQFVVSDGSSLNKRLPVKVRNEIHKKETTITSLKLNPNLSGMRDVCKFLDQFRADQNSANYVVSDELRKELMETLASDNGDSMNQFLKLLSSSSGIREFFLEEIFQETICLGSQKSTTLKTFPPDLKDNICQSLVEEVGTFAPNLLNLLIKFCTKLNEPITEKQARKIVQLASQLTSSVNQKNSCMQKLVSLKLKLSSITNSGLDFLHDLGVTQSSRSLQRDNDYLASINMDYLIEELRDKSFSYLVDNLDKVVNGNVVNFTSVILVADRNTGERLDTEVVTMENDLHDPGYLKLNEESREKYLSGAVFVLGRLLMKIYPDKFGWIQMVLGSEYKHTHSEYSEQQSFWSYIALLPLSEQNNSEMVQILDFLHELTLEIYWKTAEVPEVVKAWIDTIKDSSASEEEIEAAQNHLSDLAKKKGVPSVIGDLLTYERCFIAKQLRSGSINCIEKFDFLQFRLAMFHELMAKLRRDYSTFLPNLTNTLDKGNMAYFRARLSKHEITNDGDKIKKDGNFEKHFDFFSNIAEESLKSALEEHFSDETLIPDADQTLDNLQKLLERFMKNSNIVLYWESESAGTDPFDDLHKYHSRLVSSHLMNKIHKLFSKSGDGQGLRVVNRVATPFFLNAGGHRSKYAKYSHKDNVCHDSSSARQKWRNDLSTTVNAWGGAHSVDSDQFQEHRIKNIKGFLDSLHGNLDPSTIDKAIKSADLELKISAGIDKCMNISYKNPNTSAKFLTGDEIAKIAKMIQQIKPFSRKREAVVFKEPLVGKNNFDKLDAEPELVTEFLDRNKGQYSSWGPFV